MDPNEKIDVNLRNRSREILIDKNEEAENEIYLSNDCLDMLKSCFNIKNKSNTIYADNSNFLKAHKTTSQIEDGVMRYLEKKSNNKDVDKRKIDFDHDIREIEKCLNKGANINYQNQFKDNVLIEVCKLRPETETKRLFEYLLDKGAKIEPNYYGQTVLHYAVLNNNVSLINLILEKDIHLLERKTFEEEQTPLHYAAKRGSQKALNCLLKQYKADKEAKDYQLRTPLYLAAEYGQKSIVRILLDAGCTEKVKNIYGQKALFWIIAKCPDLAPELMDKYVESNKYTRKDTYALKNVELEPIIIEKNPNKNNKKDGLKNSDLEHDVLYKVPDAKSILAYIVETENLELIAHPVINKLVKFKWNDLARWKSYFDLFFTFINIVVWNILGVLIPYNERYKYTFPNDGWRIFLFIFGSIGMIYLIFTEIKEVYNNSNYFESVRKQRLVELEKDRAKSHPRDTVQIEFLIEEERACQKTQISNSYFQDFWNWFDIISICLLITCVFTHIADIANHNETIARAHIRIMSVTVIFISLRLLKVGRIINEEFGTLVMTLYFVVKDIIVWILAYITFWIPFTSAFYMLFNNQYVCPDDGATDTTNCSSNLKIINNMESYNKAAFGMYSGTFGGGFPADDYNKLDNIMTDILIGFYIGLTTLLMVNIFIALLTSSFSRVYDSSKAFFILQRAIEIVKIENRQAEFKKLKHLIKFKKDYEDKKYSGINKIIEISSSDRFEPVMDSMKEIRNEIEIINDRLNIIKKKEPKPKHEEENVDQSSNQNNFKKQQFNKIEKDLNDLKKLINDFVDKQEDENLANMVMSSRDARVDVLNINDIEGQIN